MRWLKNILSKIKAALIAFPHLLIAFFKQFFKESLSAIKLAAICLVCALLLAGTYALTRGPIAKQEEKAAFERMAAIFAEADTFEPVTMDDNLRNELMKTGCDEVHEAYDATGNVIGYVFVTRNFGYAGDIIVTSGFDLDGAVIQVIATAPDETPKLGKEVEKKEFTDQYTGVSAGEHAGEGSDCVDMISGATISSKAVCVAFNAAVDAFQTLSEKGVIES
ncbi:MAG: FMN-binding protein [Oscillospiraceae bacterium]|nr:FMN-binding protein [Oscillospiraceae bacterium]